jgi:hypothetical protein
MSAIGATTTLPWMWLVSRGSGLILLVLFTAVFVMGISTRLGSGSRSMPRFAVAELHRTLALFAVALLLLHVVTAILDPYVAIGGWATVLPFAAHYRPLATCRSSIVACGALARLPVMATRLHAFPECRWRYEDLVGCCSCMGIGQCGHSRYRNESLCGHPWQ